MTTAGHMVIGRCLPFQGRSLTNGMDSVFSGHEPNRLCLRKSRDEFTGSLLPPHTLLRAGKSSFGGVGQNIQAFHL